MIRVEDMRSTVGKYNKNKISVGTIGSHSALDICDGARDLGLRTIVICQKGRERTYEKYFIRKKTQDGLEKGVIDKVYVLERFKDILNIQNELIDENTIFVPNRSFVVYVGIENIEKKFKVPMFGNRFLLKIEERSLKENYYELLKKAKIPHPEEVTPEEIKVLTIVKMPHAKKKLERGFFTVTSYEEFLEKSKDLIDRGIITEEDLKRARIERYILGPVFNADMFYSPIDDEIELLGVDWRFETDLDGFVRLPAEEQLKLPESQKIPEYIVCGHSTATLRESLLDKVFEIAERFIRVTREEYPPGVIGPFTLQMVVDKDLDFYVFDVAVRIGGGTNIHMSLGHPYGNALWRQPMSTGKRIALEIKRATELDSLEEIVT
ncbi:MAG: 5-formaminoimidazole-4-carboxamide-1-(beta)-D-ribofuranosyl 5'-monophosphate synthetase [Thermoplasmata archaeon]|nr:MAG: 5-formaminoimidazole-4-carboxamide-1-(beta)-D-ribofuranosyl 5'-monophosphate synthetase [Thermoplasmata archaeon]